MLGLDERDGTPPLADARALDVTLSEIVGHSEPVDSCVADMERYADTEALVRADAEGELAALVEAHDDTEHDGSIEVDMMEIGDTDAYPVGVALTNPLADALTLTDVHIEGVAERLSTDVGETDELSDSRADADVGADSAALAEPHNDAAAVSEGDGGALCEADGHLVGVDETQSVGAGDCNDVGD